MVDVAQLVRVPDCGSEGRGFESLLPPTKKGGMISAFFVYTCKVFLIFYTPNVHGCGIVAIVAIHGKAIYPNATEIRETFAVFGR